MARFQNSTQKYDQNGIKIPKGISGIKNYTLENPNVLIFDSKSEYEIYKLLTEQLETGLISALEIKKKFDLVPAIKWFNNIKGKFENIRGVSYITDFAFVRGNEKIIVDCKGWKFKMDKKSGKEKWQVYYDDIYKLKKKLFLNKYGTEYTFEEM